MPVMPCDAIVGGIGIRVVSLVGRTCAWTDAAAMQQNTAASVVLIRTELVSIRVFMCACILSSVKT